MMKVGIFIALLALVKTGLCVNCYHCTSQQDPACGDPFKYGKPAMSCDDQKSLSFNSEYLRGALPRDVLVRVSGSPRYCFKMVSETGTVIRTCLDGNPNDMNKTCHVFDSTVIELPTKMKYCGVCNKNDCNGAGSLAVSLPLATFTLIASYLLLKQ